MLLVRHLTLVLIPALGVLFAAPVVRAIIPLTGVAVVPRYTVSRTPLKRGPVRLSTWHTKQKDVLLHLTSDGTVASREVSFYYIHL